MNESLSLVSINVENNKHVESVRRFLSDRKPDIICLQELLEHELELYKKELGMNAVFCPLTLRPRDDNGRIEKEGLAIFSKLPIKSENSRFYRGEAENLKIWNKNTPADLLETVYAAVTRIVVSSGDQDFSFATTHLTWTPDGKPTAEQFRDLDELLATLRSFGSFVLCGDFNAPRGGPVFDKLASLYRDNIPQKYASSLDPELHRRSDLKLMVDGMFSTPDYVVDDVELISGISDHCALIANVAKKNPLPDGRDSILERHGNNAGQQKQNDGGEAPSRSA